MSIAKLSQQPESSKEEIEKQKKTIEALVLLVGNREICAKKRVSFAPRVLQKKYLSRIDMNREEVEASWFSIKEVGDIRVSCAKAVMMGAKGRSTNTDNVNKSCIRGLETYFPVAQIVKERNRSTATRAVLDIQEHYRHTERSYNYEEEIAKAYHQASSSSALWARRSGLVDRSEADEIYDCLENHCTKRTKCSSIVNNMGPSTKPSRRATSKAAKAA